MAKLKTALIFGASGLIGSYLLNALSKDDRYDNLIVFVRNPLIKNFPKTTSIITDFADINSIKSNLKGDEIFCCLGTTIRKAGSQEAFRKVDFDLPVRIGEIAAKNGIPKMLVVSSLGADAKSGNFYLRTKGEMEIKLQTFAIPVLKFFRPSMLLGPRIESRPSESIGKFLMQTLSFLFIGKLNRFKAVHANTVAMAMIEAANSDIAKTYYESEEIQILIS